MVGTIGTGSFITDFSTDFTNGAPQNTGNELDFALTNGFFQVQSPDGTVYSTRDGRFGRDANGDLVTSQGDYVPRYCWPAHQPAGHGRHGGRRRNDCR